jgi:hypothetical protein
MGIRVQKSLVHWNYFLALESDLLQVSRYIEFTGSNFRTHSIELSHLLLASASEIDVIAKGICKLLYPGSNPRNIVNYRNAIIGGLPEFAKEMIYIPRFNLKMRPWYNWTQGKTPLWWESYNKVKHERNEYFPQANLKNVLNSMGALLISVFYFYKLKFMSDGQPVVADDDVILLIGADRGFLQLEDKYYPSYMLWD